MITDAIIIISSIIIVLSREFDLMETNQRIVPQLDEDQIFTSLLLMPTDEPSLRFGNEKSKNKCV